MNYKMYGGKVKMKLLLAILWSVVMVVDIISAVVGNAPNWILVFCPLIILVMDKWEDYIRSCY